MHVPTINRQMWQGVEETRTELAVIYPGVHSPGGQSTHPVRLTPECTRDPVHVSAASGALVQAGSDTAFLTSVQCWTVSPGRSYSSLRPNTHFHLLTPSLAAVTGRATPPASVVSAGRELWGCVSCRL